VTPVLLAPPGPALDVPNPCSLPGANLLQPCLVANGAKKGADAAIQVVDFASDPFGYIATKMQSGASGLANTVLPAMNKLTQPDLSADFFLHAYRISFALAIFMFVVFLGWNFVLLARRRISGDELAETMGFYVPMFFFGVMFGPLLGSMLLQLTGSLSESLISAFVGSSVGQTTDTVKAAIAAGDPAKIAGGSVVAIIFFFALIIALVLVLIVLLVMLVTLYLTGSIIPLSLSWLVQPRQRGKGLKVLMVWVGINFSHVLLFLMLGVAFALVAAVSTKFDDPGLTILGNLAVAVIALLTAALSPIGLLKFAPVGPSSADGGGPSISVPSGRSGGGYPESSGDSQTAQMARDNASSSGSGSGGGSGGAGAGGGGAGGGEAGGEGGQAGGGGLMSRLAAQRSGSGESSTSAESGGSGGAPAAASAGSSTSGAGSSGGESPAGSGDPTGSAAKATDGAGALGAQGQKQQAQGNQLAAAGTAAEATGVGAPVGAVLQGIGAAAKAGGSAATTTAGLAQAGGDMAAEHMDHGEGHDEGGSGARTRTGW